MDINQLTEFVTNHTLLVMAFVAILVMLVSGEIQQRISGIKEVGPADATRMLNHDNAIMVDMRDSKGYHEGHIVNALHVPASDDDITVKLEKYRNRPLIVYCQRGQRSTTFCNKLSKQGFESVYNLKGGVLGWQKAELPLSRDKQTT